jgi:hypothetical protein
VGHVTKRPDARATPRSLRGPVRLGIAATLVVSLDASRGEAKGQLLIHEEDDWTKRRGVAAPLSGEYHPENEQRG